MTAPSKTDLMYETLYNPTFVPIPSPKVNIRTTVVDGKPSYLMKNHATGIYYDLDELTNLIWNATDGKRTVTQIVKEVQRQKPRIRQTTILQTLLFFAESNLLVANLELAPKKRLKVVSAFEIDICIIQRSKNFFQSLNRKVQPIFKRFLLWAAIAFIIAGFLLFAGDFISIFGKKANFEILGSSVVGFFFYYFVALAPVIAIHEIAHGLALVHYGGQPGEMGTGLFYFGPMFYIDTTDAWGLRRRDRIMVYLAGNVTTLLIGSALVIARFFLTSPEPASHVVTMMAFYCFNMSLFNFAPPFETDGYYMLLDIVKMPNLRQDSYGYLGSIFRRAIGRQVKTKTSNLNKRKKVVLLVYSFLSVAWIIYIVFQSSLFLVYMGQDVTTALANIAQAVLSSQALPAAALVIAAASTLYFGMQVVGYGFLFFVSAKKATTKPLQIEAIHDRDLAVFAYLPLQSPESLSKRLKTKMERAAKKFTPNFEIKQVGRSWITVLRLGETKLALVRIKEHIKEIEKEFSSAYQNFITSHKETLQKSTGICSPHKIKLRTMLREIAAESVDAGNSTALSIVRQCEERQNETFLYLLSSVFGVVWTIEVQPAHGYGIEEEMFPSLLLEDVTLTDLYKDTENFKKRCIYGFDSLSKLATETDIGIKECLDRPDKYQLVTIFEPIKGRIIFVGRTEDIEKNINCLAPLFVAQTWSGYFDQLLSEACFTLSTINRVHLPSVREIGKMSIGELAVLKKDLSAFTENQKLVDESIKKSESNCIKVNQSLQQMKSALKQSETEFKIGLSDAVFHVNAENLEKIPSRIKELRKKWEALCKQIEKIRVYVEKEHDKRKPAIAKKKRKMLQIYPIVIMLSAILLIMTLQPSLVAWWMLFLSVALILQVAYWIVFYLTSRSFHKVTRYPSQAFNTTHLFILALTEAVYEYVGIEDVLTPI